MAATVCAEMLVALATGAAMLVNDGSALVADRYAATVASAVSPAQVPKRVDSSLRMRGPAVLITPGRFRRVCAVLAAPPTMPGVCAAARTAPLTPRETTAAPGTMPRASPPNVIEVAQKSPDIGPFF